MLAALCPASSLILCRHMLQLGAAPVYQAGQGVLDAAGVCAICSALSLTASPAPAGGPEEHKFLAEQEMRAMLCRPERMWVHLEAGTGALYAAHKSGAAARQTAACTLLYALHKGRGLLNQVPKPSRPRLALALIAAWATATHGGPEPPHRPCPFLAVRLHRGGLWRRLLRPVKW